ncbi:hypothetical protein KKG71_00900 [Patescibacteria group bacterium]|nr:hypothetical protein [Patescibacteria group bacterium]
MEKRLSEVCGIGCGDLFGNEGQFGIPENEGFTGLYGHPILQEEETNALLELAQSGDNFARNKLLLHNVRFIARQVHSFLAISGLRTYLDFDDCMSEGVMVFFRCVKNFKKNKGENFHSYLRVALRRELHKFPKTCQLQNIRIPRYIWFIFIQIVKEINSWNREGNEDVENEDVENIDISAITVDAVMRAVLLNAARCEDECIINALEGKSKGKQAHLIDVLVAIYKASFEKLTKEECLSDVSLDEEMNGRLREWANNLMVIFNSKEFSFSDLVRHDGSEYVDFIASNNMSAEKQLHLKKSIEELREIVRRECKKVFSEADLDRNIEIFFSFHEGRNMAAVAREYGLRRDVVSCICRKIQKVCKGLKKENYL